MSMLQIAQMTDAVYGRQYAGLPKLRYCTDVDTEYAEVRRDGDMLHFIFQGTDESLSPWSQDWRRNLDIRYAPVMCNVDHGSVHNGLYNAVMDVVAPLMRVVKREVAGHREDVEICCEGHSHGGPMASVFAAMLAHRGYTVAAVFTFGCPNYCDEQWAKSHAPIPHVHYVAGTWPGWRDPVAAHPVRMTKPGSVVRLPGRFGPLHNHRMSNYVRLLAE